MDADMDPDLFAAAFDVLGDSPDSLRAGSHRHMASHLVGPLQPGAADAPLDITVAGRVTLPADLLRPLLVAAPRAAVPHGSLLRLRATPAPDAAGASPLPAREWPAYTEAGTFLHLDRPPVGETGRTAADVVYALAVEKVDADGTVTVVPPADVAGLVTVHVLQGNLGRMLFALAAEKGRIRRTGREIHAARQLGQARGGALDRHGQDLGVERFRERLRWDPAGDELVTETLPGGEADDDYRDRLGIYRAFETRTRTALLTRLRSVDPSFSIVEEDNPIAVALHLVQTGEGTHRARFLEHVRDTYLVFPANTAAANQRHGARALSIAQQADVAALRKSIRDRWTLPAGPAGFAPVLAAALDRAGRALVALGVPKASLIVQRAQEDDGGSRYELGLGAEVAALSSIDAETARATLLDRGWPQRTDAETSRVLSLLADGSRPIPVVAADLSLSWLWKALGLQTVHPTTTGWYLSHLPTFGLAISGPSAAHAGEHVVLEAHYNAPGDPGANAVLAAGLAAARAAWNDAGETPWTEPGPGGMDALLAGVSTRGVPTAAERHGLAGAGLPVAPDPARVATQLKNPRLADVAALLLLAPEVSAPLLSDANPGAQEVAAAKLRRLLSVMRGKGFSAALPLITGDGGLALVVGVTQLPLVGTNLSDRRTTGFRWYSAPVPAASGGVAAPAAGAVGAVGGRTTFTAAAAGTPGSAGLSVVAVLGYARDTELTDPYEYRVGLADDARLSHPRYEFVMNLLAANSPIGVEINTFALRRHHVDLDGDGDPEPLTPSVARTYRQFRRPRSFGEVEDFAQDV
jgi:hypothetical protein